MPKGNEYWVGNGKNDRIWVNDTVWDRVKAFSAKVTGEFEEIPDPDGYGTVQVFNGFTGEGTITIRKTDSRVLTLLSEAFSKGIMPEIKIVSRATNQNTGKTERIAYKDVTITEFDLANYEEKAIKEMELPFKFGSYEPLETV